MRREQHQVMGHVLRAGDDVQSTEALLAEQYNDENADDDNETAARLAATSYRRLPSNATYEQ